MCSIIHSLDCAGDIFHPELQVETISTTDVPRLLRAFKCFLQGGLGFAHGGRGVHGLAGYVAGSVQAGEDIADFQRVAVKVGTAAVGRCGGLLAQEGGGGHLSAGHAVDGVVDKHYHYVLTAVGGMDGLGGADSGQVAVTLIGEHHVLRIEAREGCGYCGSAAVGGLHPVYVDVVVCKYGATHGSHTHCGVLHAEFVDDFGHKFMHHAVAATGAVMRVYVQQEARARHHLGAVGYDFFACHACILFSGLAAGHSAGKNLLKASRISVGVGIMPPRRPKW